MWAWPYSDRCKDLDVVAYLRFASVYRAYESLEDFEAAIAELRVERPPAVEPGTAVPAPAPASQ